MNGYRSWSGKHWLTGEPITVYVKGGKVHSIEPGSAKPADANSPWIAPGLIDLQVNGIHKIDFNDPATTVEQIGIAVRYLQQIGVVRFCPTVVTSSKPSMASCIRRIAEACEADEVVARAVIGIHVEGPFLSAEDGPRGAHSKESVRDPDWDEYLEWETASGGRIAKVTLAPERDGAAEFIRRLKERGVVAAIGHTSASETHIREAVEAGATMSTHLGNGAHPFIRRHPNYIWEQLAEDRLWAGLIADGHHLPSATLKAMIRAKGRKAILVSDANHYEGYEPGRYMKRNRHEVILRPDGKLFMAATPDILSGAALGLHRGVENVAKFGICTLGEAIQMASLHPAEMIGIRQSGGGTLEPGANANLIVYRTNANNDFDIAETVVDGKTVHVQKK
ncbi:MAG: N-acetylglucosamine-6-phosphate deacetylase [Paenibacillus sp.]|jgi:N-acetylglucosamine-6-phosphate deacetylase|nr:N-acetylglucosamine-6-phosphate deacetylase [Paenibacillus sp.]